MLIQVAALFGQHCVTTEDGEQLNRRICAPLSAGDNVELDFSDVRVCASPFFNAMLGTLLRDYTAVELNSRVQFRGLTPVAIETLRLAIDNSREYFANPRVRERLDALGAEQSGEHHL
jgi:hypothetical protein